VPGTVIRVQPLAGAAALPSATRNFLVLYHSTNPDGRDVAVSGTIAIPAGDTDLGRVAPDGTARPAWLRHARPSATPLFDGYAKRGTYLREIATRLSCC
jgi:hypothetical protein